VIDNWDVVSFAEIRTTMPMFVPIEDQGREHP
jgi:hypothetical protein